MFYLSGSVRGNLLGVKDTNDNIEEFYSEEFLRNCGLRIAGLNTNLNIGATFQDEYFIYEYENTFGLKIILREEYKNVEYLKPVLKNTVAGVKVCNVSFLFKGLKKLIKLDLSEFDTKYVTSFSSFLYGCTNLESIEMSNIDVRNVRYTISMFAFCKKLRILDLSSFYLCNIQDMSNMFTKSGVVELNIKNFNISNNVRQVNTFMNCEDLRFIIINEDCLNILYYIVFYNIIYIVIDSAKSTVEDLLNEIKSCTDSKDYNLILLNYNLPCNEPSVRYFENYNSLRSKILLLDKTVDRGIVYIQGGS